MAARTGIVGGLVLIEFSLIDYKKWFITFFESTLICLRRDIDCIKKIGASSKMIYSEHFVDA